MKYCAVKSAPSSKYYSRKIEPYNRCYLLIEFRRMTYVGALVFDDVMFCRQLCELLQNHHLGKLIKEIGDLEVDRFL
jgi:hypothetical protein